MGGRYLKVGVALSDMKNSTQLFFQNDLRKVMNVINGGNLTNLVVATFFIKLALVIITSIVPGELLKKIRQINSISSELNSCLISMELSFSIG